MSAEAVDMAESLLSLESEPELPEQVHREER